MPAQQQHHITSAFLSAGTIVRGQCAVKVAAGTGYVVATTANRATAERRVTGIALGAATSTPGDNAFEIQVVGELPPEVTGLPPGGDPDAMVRVSSTGVLERTITFSSDVCGYADPDGTAHVCFALMGLGPAIGAIAASLPARSVQHEDSGNLGGAAHVTVSTDGDLELRTASESVASSGKLRVGYAPGGVIKALDVGGVTRTVLDVSSGAVTIGSAALPATTIDASTVLIGNVGGVRKFWSSALAYFAAVPRLGDGTPYASEGEAYVADAAPYTLSDLEYALVSVVLTHAGGGTYTFPAVGTAPAAYLKVVGNFGAATKTITNGGGTDYSIAAGATRLLKFTTFGVFEVGADGGDQGATVEVDETPLETYVDLGTWPDRITTIVLTTTGETYVEIGSFPAPEAGRTGVLHIVNRAGAYGRITHNTGEDVVNSCKLPGNVDFTFSEDGTRTLIYDPDAARWVPLGDWTDDEGDEPVYPPALALLKFSGRVDAPYGVAIGDSGASTLVAIDSDYPMVGSGQVTAWKMTVTGIDVAPVYVTLNIAGSGAQILTFNADGTQSGSPGAAFFSDGDILQVVVTSATATSELVISGVLKLTVDA